MEPNSEKLVDIFDNLGEPIDTMPLGEAAQHFKQLEAAERSSHNEAAGAYRRAEQFARGLAANSEADKQSRLLQTAERFATLAAEREAALGTIIAISSASEAEAAFLRGETLKALSFSYQLRS